MNKLHKQMLEAWEEKPDCSHSTTIGSYPGERWVVCRRPKGHADEHEGTVSWSQTWTECDTCIAPDETDTAVLAETHGSPDARSSERSEDANPNNEPNARSTARQRE